MSSDDQCVAPPDRAALEAELATRFAGPLQLFLARRLRDLAAAEDITQTVLQRVVAALQTDRVRNLDALPAFVYQTARHLCLHRSRSAGRERRALLSLAVAPPPAPDTDALATLIAEERAAAVRQAVQSLRPGDRELLRLLYYEMLEPVEASRRLGISQGALRVRKHRALGRLSELLDESVGQAGNGRTATGTGRS